MTSVHKWLSVCPCPRGRLRVAEQFHVAQLSGRRPAACWMFVCGGTGQRDRAMRGGGGGRGLPFLVGKPMGKEALFL